MAIEAENLQVNVSVSGAGQANTALQGIANTSRITKGVIGRLSAALVQLSTVGFLRAAAGARRLRAAFIGVRSVLSPQPILGMTMALVAMGVWMRKVGRFAQVLKAQLLSIGRQLLVLRKQLLLSSTLLTQLSVALRISLQTFLRFGTNIQLVVNKLLIFRKQLLLSVTVASRMVTVLRMSAVALQQNIVRVTKLQLAFAKLSLQIQNAINKLNILNQKLNKTNLKFKNNKKGVKGFNEIFNGTVGAVAAAMGIFAGFIAILEVVGGTALITSILTGVLGSAITALGSPVLVIAGLLTLLAAGAVALYAAWQSNLFGIRDITKRAVDFIIGHLDLVAATLAFLANPLDGLLVAWQTNLFGIRDITNRVIDDIMGLFASLPENIVDTITKGFKREFPRVYDVVSNQIDSTIATLMPSSDAKEGPLSHLTASGKALPATLAKGIEANIRPLSRASEQTALAAQPTLKASGASLLTGIGLQRSSTSSTVVTVNVDARGASDPGAVGTHVADELRSVLSR